MNVRGAVILAGCTSFLISLVVMMPASIAYHFGMTSMGGIRLDNPEGSVWSGQAGSLSVQETVFHGIAWKVNPLSILTGKLDLDITSRDELYPLKGNIIAGFNGSIQARNVKGTLNANIIRQIKAVSFIGLEGKLNIDLKDLSFDKQGIRTASGEILFSRGRLVQPVQGNLGNIKLTLSNQGDNVNIRIKDLQGPIGIDGILRLQPKHRFNFNASFTPTPASDVFLLSMIKNAARQGPDGRLQIQYDGAY